MKHLALHTIYNCITSNGILASSNQVDNYARVWSRDGIMTSIVGIILHDEKIMLGGVSTILNLAKHQSQFGQIPSNISFINDDIKVSFGTHVGRVDATTWWIIGASIYLKNAIHLFTKDEIVLIEKSIKKALQILHAWEFNNKGFLFTPLGGNWADEYVSQGYTLYDNTLRYWAVKSASNYFNDSELILQEKLLHDLIIDNFNSKKEQKNSYHQQAYESFQKQNLAYMPSSFSANGYDTRWDMAGNSLALLLGLNAEVKSLESYLENLYNEFAHWMLPVFHPIITPESNDWNLLNNNYNYNFKNHPYCFHNGGSWPIFLGWLGLALAQNNSSEIANKIFNEYHNLLTQNNNFTFNEYFNSQTLEPAGTKNLCFSAIGYLLLEGVNSKNINLKSILS